MEKRFVTVNVSGLALSVYRSLMALLILIRDPTVVDGYAENIFKSFFGRSNRQSMVVGHHRRSLLTIIQIQNESPRHHHNRYRCAGPGNRDSTRRELQF